MLVLTILLVFFIVGFLALHLAHRATLKERNERATYNEQRLTHDWKSPTPGTQISSAPAAARSAAQSPDHAIRRRGDLRTARLVSRQRSGLMPLPPADEAITADMKQRELHLKHAARHRRDPLRDASLPARAHSAAGDSRSGGGDGLFLLVNGTLSDQPGWQGRLVLDIVLGAIIGVQLALLLLRTPWGRRLIDRKQTRLYSRYASELHAGRRWQHFYYRDEEISAYVPQILHYLEGDKRFESVGNLPSPSPRRTATPPTRSPHEDWPPSTRWRRRRISSSSPARTSRGHRPAGSCASPKRTDRACGTSRRHLKDAEFMSSSRAESH